MTPSVLTQAQKKPAQGHEHGQGHGHEQGQGHVKGHGQRPKRFQNIMKEIVSGMKKKEKESYHLNLIFSIGTGKSCKGQISNLIFKLDS